MRESNRGLSDDEARELWRRAAEMQAAAEQAHAAGRALQPVEPGALSVAQVTAAAEGAGIHPDFVRVALAERRLPDAGELRHEHWTGRWLRRVIREPDTIECERIIGAAPQVVLAATRTIVTGHVYQLTAEDTTGDDPVRDGVLVYRIAGAGTTFGTTMNFADARVLLITIRPHEDGTRMRVRVPLFRRGTNLALTGATSGLLGAGGWAAGGAIGAALGAAALVALPAAGVLAGGALGVGAYRRAYRWARNQGTAAVTQLMQAIATEAQTVGGAEAGAAAGGQEKS